MRLMLAAALLATTAATPALAGPQEDYDALTERYWQWQLEQYPTLASSVGVKDHDDRLTDMSLEAMDERTRTSEFFLARLRAIPGEQLTERDRVNKAILERDLETAIEGAQYGQRLINFTNRSGWHQSIAGLANNLTFRSAEDYDNYLKRLAAYPAQNEQAIAVADAAVEGGYVLPCTVLDGYAATISGVIGEDVTTSRLYGPFAGERPDFIDDGEWARYQARAAALIDGELRAAYDRQLAWFEEDYLPHCAEAVGVSAQPGGAAYYAYRARLMTTTELTPDEIHQIGLSEVARIRAEMEAVAAEAGFETREAFIEDLRTNPVYYAETPEELMRYVAREAKKIDGLMPTLFTVLPRLPYGLAEIPAEIAPGTTTAYYNPGSPQNGIAGLYYVNTSKLDQRPLWEVPALTVHEGVPGHHHQIALAQEIDQPDWRRNLFFTAFVEGWGLYSERLGIEMGLYDTPAKEMGRLSYEMWRATRLVVDTGIHAKGWSKDRAIAYMLDNTALSPANIEAEVNRYISWPGQALAYKIGELKIRELRTLAEETLGRDFDLRRFHDVVLGSGAVPLDVLEGNVRAWIAAEQAG
ncbi:DUF885 domain-containing protein [Sphingomicrobium astaxanthinifaciens]|uniref:DUF885 domain-containing protein n=1 Tax=Sphingomicrobium astaxanthinifaciens TaxID=1227949 RepID=UPI001FCBB43C|nr:DUF885 domain-containing protein [Sphingomicrobium astaxanthinifaciens]MCJ7421521.1 DUF885 domain-containing protein [Sphingomicrobium astaxanthinifaciens]